MGSSFQDSGRYASAHESPNGPGDTRPTSLQVLEDNDAIDRLYDKVILVTGKESMGRRIYCDLRPFSEAPRASTWCLFETHADPSTY